MSQKIFVILALGPQGRVTQLSMLDQNSELEAVMQVEDKFVLGLLLS